MSTLPPWKRLEWEWCVYGVGLYVLTTVACFLWIRPKGCEHLCMRTSSFFEDFFHEWQCLVQESPWFVVFFRWFVATKKCFGGFTSNMVVWRLVFGWTTSFLFELFFLVEVEVASGSMCVVVKEMKFWLHDQLACVCMFVPHSFVNLPHLIKE